MAGLTSLTPVGMAAGLAGGAVQAGLGIYGAIKGAQVAKQAEQDRLAAREEIANTKYADYNQMYYDELQRRANVGLPQEQLMAMQQGADRAAGVGLATSEDRRGGLVGIGRAASGLANAYSQIGLADVAARQQNAQMVLGEMANRGQQTYGEVQQLNQYDLAIAQQRRIEGIQQQQAGLQSITSGVANAGTFLGGTQAAVNPFGTNDPSRTDVTPMQTMQVGSVATPNTNQLADAYRYLNPIQTLQVSDVASGANQLMNANRAMPQANVGYITGGAVPTGLMGSVYGVY